MWFNYIVIKWKCKCCHYMKLIVAIQFVIRKLSINIFIPMKTKNVLWRRLDTSEITILFWYFVPISITPQNQFLKIVFCFYRTKSSACAMMDITE